MGCYKFRGLGLRRGFAANIYEVMPENVIEVICHSKRLISNPWLRIPAFKL